MSLRILVNGAFGRMGQITTKTITAHPHFELVGQVGREYDLRQAIQDSKAQIVIDFTDPESVFTNTTTIIDSGAHPVIGTTGLTASQIQLLQERCQQLKLGGIIAPNFSLGAVLMMKHARDIVKYMPHVEIVEMHHDNKIDSPSGTALRSAEILANACNQINPIQKKFSETISGARGARHHHVPIHAIRLPGLLARQSIIFGNAGETLTLHHDSINRECFMPGICLACEKVPALDKLVYGLEEIL
jgi:4-hydroxy-tetrahydrodipicolinate reductase